GDHRDNDQREGDHRDDARRGGDHRDNDRRERDHRDDDRREGDPRVREYHAIEREIDAAFRAGKLSEEEAERKLIATRKRLFEDR
ncbi:MAG: hypothetical protein VCG02_05800, partial [Verrucomicrobiota bacterium]